MGFKLLSMTLASLIMLGFIDAFISWYQHFLDRRLPFPNIKPMLINLIWVILTILFWLHMYVRHIPESFEMSHFLFVAFIYSIKGLITSFFKKEATS